jgi:S1-C subfamily serine protease
VNASPRFLALVALAGLSAGCSSNAKPLERDPFVHAFEIVRPSVVLFTMQIPSDDPHKKGQWDDAYGSGIIVASGEWGSQVLTVEHVVADARNLRATIRERTVVPVRIVARDKKADLALLETSKPNLPVAALGTAKHLEPGAPIGIAGYPIPDAFADEGLGVATSVFFGRISSIRKGTLELDLAIIPGESGGPVFDARTGTVIGLAESRFEEEKAIGFAIPIDDAEKFLKGKLHAPSL